MNHPIQRKCFFWRYVCNALSYWLFRKWEQPKVWFSRHRCEDSLTTHAKMYMLHCQSLSQNHQACTNGQNEALQAALKRPVSLAKSDRALLVFLDGVLHNLTDAVHDFNGQYYEGERLASDYHQRVSDHRIVWYLELGQWANVGLFGPRASVCW